MVLIVTENIALGTNKIKSVKQLMHIITCTDKHSQASYSQVLDNDKQMSTCVNTLVYNIIHHENKNNNIQRNQDC